jgi:hypothetical protein
MELSETLKKTIRKALESTEDKEDRQYLLNMLKEEEEEKSMITAEEFIQQLVGLSSGTIANLTGFKKYYEMDSFVNFAIETVENKDFTTEDVYTGIEEIKKLYNKK